MNYRAACLARAAAEQFAASSGRPAFVAGSIGPTSRMTSMSPDVNDPGFRSVTFDELTATYRDSARALLAGGVDLLLIETVIDTLNAKAAIYAALELFEQSGVEVPIIISGTITDASGRILSGQTADAFAVDLMGETLDRTGLGALEVGGADADRGTRAQAAVAVLAGVGKRLRLLDVLDRHQADQPIVVVDHEQLLDPMAVEKLHPDVGSVIELGGQDAKIIMFKKNEETGDKTAQTSMNDKCASGTGATIEVHPDGGVLAQVEGRRLALTLDAAADRALRLAQAGLPGRGCRRPRRAAAASVARPGDALLRAGDGVVLPRFVRGGDALPR